jgi:DNA-binding NarL/FixJ family response regulator
LEISTKFLTFSADPNYKYLPKFLLFNCVRRYYWFDYIGLFLHSKMSKPLTILLIDHSPITSVRLVELLQDTTGVDNVFYSKDVKKGCAMFAVSVIDVLILATHIVNDELLALSELCKLFGCSIIMLSEYTHASYITWCSQIGITHLLDKASEVDQVVQVLKNFR